MNLGTNGKIQSKQAPNDILQNLSSVLPGSTLQISWPWPVTTSSENQQLGFTNLMRWRTPEVKAQTLDPSVTPHYNKIDYEIEVSNEPTETRKLTDYLKVGYYKTEQNKAVLGLMLASNLKLDDDFTFPKGKIIIRSTALTTTLSTEIDFNEKKRLYEDKLEFEATWFSKDHANYIAWEANEFLMNIQTTEFTRNAQLKELLLNLPLQVQINDSKFKNCIKATLEDGYINCKVTDRTAYEKALGNFAPGGETKNLKMNIKLIFPNGIYEEVEGEGRLSVGKY